MASRFFRHGSLLWGATLCCCFACGKRSTEEPVASGPRLRLEPARLELGNLGFEEPTKGHIAVFNDGKGPLVVERVDASRFCSGSIAAATVQPGTQEPLEVSCRSDLAGPLREQLTLHTNDTANAAAKIDVVGNVVPILAFDTPLLHQTMPFGEARSEETRLMGKLAPKAELSLISGREPALEITLLPAATAKVAGLRVRCKADKVGEHVGQLVVATGLQEPAQLSLSWACKVQGTLEVNPTNPYFNLKISGPQSLFVDVKSKQSGFELRSVRIKEGPYRASIVLGDAAGVRRVKVEFADELLKDESRGVNGTLVIHSNDRTEPEKEIPLFGFGKRNRVAAPEP